VSNVKIEFQNRAFARKSAVLKYHHQV